MGDPAGWGAANVVPERLGAFAQRFVQRRHRQPVRGSPVVDDRKRILLRGVGDERGAGRVDLPPECSGAIHFDGGIMRFSR